MKYFLVTAATTLIITSCATAGNQCISKSKAGGQPVDFGSKEAAAAHASLPRYLPGRNSEDNSAKIIAAVNTALDNYEMTPEGETLFLRRRLAAHQDMLNNDAAKADIKRLIALDRLNRNEGPYLSARLESLSLIPEVNYDRQAQPLIRIPPRISQAALSGNNSGHCTLEFDVSPSGVPENISVGYCTRDVFRESSIKSLAKWKYSPAIRNGKAVPRKNVVTTISYKIQDACGRLLPE